MSKPVNRSWCFTVFDKERLDLEPHKEQINYCVYQQEVNKSLCRCMTEENLTENFIKSSDSMESVGQTSESTEAGFDHSLTSNLSGNVSTNSSSIYANITASGSSDDESSPPPRLHRAKKAMQDFGPQENHRRRIRPLRVQERLAGGREELLHERRDEEAWNRAVRAWAVRNGGPRFQVSEGKACARESNDVVTRYEVAGNTRPPLPRNTILTHEKPDKSGPPTAISTTECNCCLHFLYPYSGRTSRPHSTP